MGRKRSAQTIHFFDRNTDFYLAKGVSQSSRLFLEYIQARQNRLRTLLDIGGGNGVFAQLVKDTCGFPVLILDPSMSMLRQVADPRIPKIRAGLPNLPFSCRFDIIHLKEVLHHITADSVSGSRHLVRHCLCEICTHLDDDGFALVQELYYEGYSSRHYPEL